MPTSELVVRSLILAGGFGLRMKDFNTGPKGLIPVDGDTIIGRMLSDLNTIHNLGQKALITNGKHFTAYQKWLLDWKEKEKGLDRIRLINNLVDAPDKRLGALGDLIHALNLLDWWGGGLFVLPSDTLYRGSLASFVDFALNTASPGLVTAVYEKEKQLIAGRLGCVGMDGQQIVHFEEKPEKPLFSSAIAPFYYYSGETLGQVLKYSRQNGSLKALDTPSSIISWFLQKGVPVYGFRTDASMDIGTPEDVEAAQIYVQANPAVNIFT